MDHSMYPVFAAVEQRHWWFVGRQAIFLRAMKKFITSSDHRVLDVGCGTGGMLPLLKHFGQVTGTDIDQQAVNFARQRGYHSVDLADAVKLPYPNNSFSVVSAVDLIEHIEDESAFMTELIRVTKPGGYLFITSAAMPWLWSRLDTLNKHYRRYTKSSFKRATTHTNLETLMVRFYNVLLFLPIACIRLIQHFLPNQPTSADHLSELQIPPAPINIPMRLILSWERFFLTLPIPFGVSIFGIYRVRK